MKLGHQHLIHPLPGRDSPVIISSDPLALLRSVDVAHPVGTLVREALEGMQVGFGSGVTTMVTLLGAICSQQRQIREAGIPLPEAEEGFRKAEKICLQTLRHLAIPTGYFFREHWARSSMEFQGDGRELTEQEQTTSVLWDTSTPEMSRRGQQEKRGQGVVGMEGMGNMIGTARAFKILAGALQHDSYCGALAYAPQDTQPSLSTPADLANKALHALLQGRELQNGSNSGVFHMPDSSQITTRTVMGPQEDNSFIVVGGALVEVTPVGRARACVADVFESRGVSSTRPSTGTIPSHLVKAAIPIAAVVVVTGDCIPGAGGSEVALSQTTITSVLSHGDALLQRLTAGRTEELWAEKMLDLLKELEVEALVATGCVSQLLLQGCVSQEILVLPQASLDEAEAVAAAAGTSTIPRLDDLQKCCTSNDSRTCTRCQHQCPLRCPQQGYDQVNDKDMEPRVLFSQHRDEGNVEPIRGVGSSQVVAGKGSGKVAGLGPCSTPLKARAQDLVEMRSEDLGLKSHTLRWGFDTWGSSDGAHSKKVAKRGMAAFLVEAGWTADAHKVFLPGSRGGEGPRITTPDLFVVVRARGSTLPRPAVTKGLRIEDLRPDRNGGRVLTGEGAESKGRLPVLAVLCSSSRNTCEELRHRFWRVFSRLSCAFKDGQVLPGAGVCEVACAVALELEASRLQETLQYSPLPHRLYDPIVLRAMAAALDEVVMTCLHNAGWQITPAMERLSKAKLELKDFVKDLLWSDPEPSKDPKRSMLDYVAGGCRGGEPLPPPLLEWCPEIAFMGPITPPGADDLHTGSSPLRVGGDQAPLDVPTYSPKWVRQPRGEMPLKGLGEAGEPGHGSGAVAGTALVLDNFGSKLACLRRTLGLAGLLGRLDGTLLSTLPAREAQT